MLKKSSLRSFIWCYSLFYYFFRFRFIHSSNNFPLLVRVCLSILPLETERYKSKYKSIIKRENNKWTASHEILRRARFRHINIFFLEVIFGFKKSKGTLNPVYHCKQESKHREKYLPCKYPKKKYSNWDTSVLPLNQSNIF